MTYDEKRAINLIKAIVDDPGNCNALKLVRIHLITTAHSKATVAAQSFAKVVRGNVGDYENGWIE